MRRAFRTLDQADVTGKRVLLRVDLNVPMENGRVTDRTRIERVAPTITEIADKGGKVILLSHFGRPKGRDPKQSLKPVAAALADVLGAPGGLCRGLHRAPGAGRGRGNEARRYSAASKTRASTPARRRTTRLLSRSSRRSATFTSTMHSRPRTARTLRPKDLRISSLPLRGAPCRRSSRRWRKALETPQRPVAAIVGGAKISTKLDLLGNLLDKVDVLIIGGGMANTFLAAQGKAVGKSLCERDLIPTAQAIVAQGQAEGPRAWCCRSTPWWRKKFEAHAPSRVVDVDHVGPQDMILDIGERSIEHVVSSLARAKTLVWNGPFGAFELEPFDNGTVEVAEAAAELTQAGKLVTVAGGGDTVAALNAGGRRRPLTYVSTAGGAFLEWLEGKALPGVEALRAR